MLKRCGLMGIACYVFASAAQADCQADQGSVTSISASGVTVTCDTADPNPFTSGIGSQATNTDLTVEINADSIVETGGTGVRLASGGSLENAGTVRSSGDAVVVTDSLGATSPTISNEGTITSTGAAGISIGQSFNNASVTNSGTLRAVTQGVAMPGGQLDNSGTISVSGDDGTAVSAGSATVNNSGTITGTAVGVSGSGTLDNSGRIEARSSGVVLTGGTLVNSGTIEVSDSSGVAVAAENSTLTNTGTVTSDATAFSLTGGSLDNSSTINGQVELGSGASLTNSGSINSTVTAAGDTAIVNSGTISAGDNALLLSGGSNTVTLQSGSTVTGAIRATIDGVPTDTLVLEGQGTLGSTVENFGTLILRGNTWNLSGNASVRSVDIESGRLNVNGTLDTRVGTAMPGVIDLARGTLGGTGTVIATLNNPSGTVAPGAATGTLTIDGDYTQGTAGTLRVASDASGRVGVLQVNGTASLAGTVVVQAGSDGIYDFLRADGGIEGSFDELVVDGRALVTLVPSASDTTLSFVRASTTVEDNMVYAALDTATLTLDGLQTGGRTPGQSGLWVRPLAHYGERDESEGIAGGDFTVAGAMAGVDWSFGNLRAGLGAGYTKTDLDIDDGGEGEVDNTVYGAYVEYATGQFHGSLTLAGGSGEYEHQRSIFINDQRSQASADYDGDTIALRLAIGGNLPMRSGWGDSWLFEPELRADYILVDLDPYTETGGTGLRIAAEDDIEAAEFAALFHIRRKSMNELGLAPRVHFGVVHRIAIDDREWSASDGGSGVSLLLPGDDEEVTNFRFGAGFDFELGRRWVGAVDYLGEVGNDGDGHSLVAGIKFRL